MFTKNLLKEALKDRFVVTLLDGTSFDGLLLDYDNRVVQMVQVTADENLEYSKPVKLDGSVYLERSKIAYMQRPGGD